MDEACYRYWLCNIPGLGNARIERLYNLFGSARDIYHASEKILKASNILKDKDIQCIRKERENPQIFTEYLQLNKKNIRLITLWDADYPKRLKNIYDKPVCLYLKGKFPDEDIPSVAIVGARNCSEYGRQTAHLLGRKLAEHGVNVISGLARGIDGAGHLGALSVGGYTLGVLAGGVDICYPRENIDLYVRMEETGGIISEYPPGMEPLPKHFPLRNRIISGLSDVVVVVEAREKSGSLITADMALEQNRTVMAVPGRICDKLSKGCNDLILQGAGIVCGVENILENLDCEFFITDSNEKKIINLLAREEEMLYSCLDLTPKNLNTIIEETGLEMSVVTASLVSMEFRGMVKEVSRGYYVRAGIQI